MKVKIKKVGAVFLLLTIAWSFVIWSFSVKDAESSTVDSDSAASVVESVIENLIGEDVELDTNIIRKLAHFTEFSVLGTLAYLTLYFFEIKIRRRILLYGGLWCLAVAVTDVCLQLFSSGRSAQLSDVLLDFSGAVLMMLVCTGVFTLTERNRQRTQ